MQNREYAKVRYGVIREKGELQLNYLGKKHRMGQQTIELPRENTQDGAANRLQVAKYKYKVS